MVTDILAQKTFLFAGLVIGITGGLFANLFVTSFFKVFDNIKKIHYIIIMVLSLILYICLVIILLSKI